MAKGLASFTVTGAGDEYLISIEDEDGDTIELTASYDQLELIAEAIEQPLGVGDDDALEVEDE